MPCHRGHEYVWSVRAQCCDEDGTLRYGEPSEEWSFFVAESGEVVPPGDCPPCPTGNLPGAPVAHQYAAPVSSAGGQPILIEWDPATGFSSPTYQVSIFQQGTQPCGGFWDDEMGEAETATCALTNVGSALQFDIEPLGWGSGGYEWAVRAFCEDDPDCPTEWSQSSIFVE